MPILAIFSPTFRCLCVHFQTARGTRPHVASVSGQRPVNTRLGIHRYQYALCGRGGTRPDLGNSSPRMDGHTSRNVSRQRFKPHVESILANTNWISLTVTAAYRRITRQEPGLPISTDTDSPGQRRASSWAEESRLATKPMEKRYVTPEARENPRDPREFHCEMKFKNNKPTSSL